jgi:hypothetical protein
VADRGSSIREPHQDDRPHDLTGYTTSVQVNQKPKPFELLYHFTVAEVVSSVKPRRISSPNVLSLVLQDDRPHDLTGYTTSVQVNQNFAKTVLQRAGSAVVTTLSGGNETALLSRRSITSLLANGDDYEFCRALASVAWQPT